MEIKAVRDESNNVLSGQSMVNHFKSYFTSVISNLSSGMPSVDGSEALNSVFTNPHSFYFVSSSSNEINKIILNIKSKPCNMHDISIDALKSIVDFLSNYLNYLYNTCIQSGVYPDYLKYGRVIPIFKSGDIDIATNYRLITTLLSINKIFEKLTLQNE